MRFLSKAAMALRMLAGVIVVVLVLITGYDVIMRYVFARPLDWSITISSVGLIAIIMLAIPDVSLRGEHIAMDLFYRQFSRRQKKIADGIVAAAAFAVCLTAGLVSLNTFFAFFSANIQTAGNFNIPVWIHYFLVAFGFLTSAVTIPLQYALGLREGAADEAELTSSEESSAAESASGGGGSSASAAKGEDR